jgi:hypothetical protein
MNQPSLPDALTIYYQRTRGKIDFCNGMSLNTLALAMWEESGFCSMDGSVLSKVLSGKRLFTPQQLNSFCNVLNITGSDREYLFYCLHRDYCRRNGIVLAEPFVAAVGTHAFIDALMQQAEALLWSGKWRDLYELSSLLESYLREHLRTVYQHNPEDPLVTTYHKAVCLRARSLLSIAPQATVRHEMRAVIAALRRYPNKAFAHLTPNYIASFEASAHRVLGLFPSPLNASFNRQRAIKSRQCAIYAMQALPPTDVEYLASLRNVADSSIALNERGAFLDAARLAEQVLLKQPTEHFLGAMNIAATVAKGLAVFNAGEPLLLKERVQKHFGKTLASSRIFELSELKTELETHVALRSAKTRQIEQKIQRALTLAQEESVRYTGVILQLSEQL